MNKILSIRYWLIEKLVGDMPIVMNVNIARPNGFAGKLVFCPYPEKPGIFSHMVLLGEERENLITPTRDVHEDY